jgi:hypothetical protein
MPDPPPLDRPLLVPEAPAPAHPARRSPWPAVAKVALVMAAAVASLAANWLRWINPFVDSGREMNVPARLAAGERLYRDIVFYYGPAGPWLQALVLRASGGAAGIAGRPRSLSPGAAPAAALAAGPSWLPLEIACLALAAAILFLLYRLAATAGGPRSALAATALAAAFCLGAPHGGAFIFPYSASSLYALAGALLALVASLGQPGWRRRALVAAGVALALTARAEIGAATALILLIATVRFRPGLSPGPAPGGADRPGRSPGPPGSPSAAPRGATSRDAPAAAPRPAAPFLTAEVLAGVADLSLGVAAALAIYAAAFGGVSWHLLLAQGPLTHALAMPPEWKELYGSVSGLGRLDHSLPVLAWGLAFDALALLVCAWPSRAARLPPRLVFAAAVVAAFAAVAWWGGPLRWPWSRIADDLPPVLFPLPLAAGAAALAALRRPLTDRGRARFMLFALAAALGSRVVLGNKIGPGMTAYCALPLPLLLATGGVLGADLLAPRLRDPGGFRFRFAVLAAALAGLHLFRLGALAWGPHIVKLETPGGSLRLPWKEANAIAGTLDYLAARARPGDRLASFPEAGFFNFVIGLPNPMREEEIFPGVLGGGREAEATARLLASRPRFVLLANRPTPEFGPRAFGDDYATSLWSAVEDHYSLAATFGNAAEDAPIGARRFFIRIYEPDPVRR